MKLLLIRHGDPDYSIDSLTEKGWKEAEYLSQRLAKLDIKAFYVSPLGRAKDTASCTLKKLGRTAVEKTWLREFQVQIKRPDRPERDSIPWDWLPQDWMKLSFWCRMCIVKSSAEYFTYAALAWNVCSPFFGDHGGDGRAQKRYCFFSHELLWRYLTPVCQ